MVGIKIIIFICCFIIDRNGICAIEKAGDLEKAKEMYMKAYELDNTWTVSKEKAEAL